MDVGETVEEACVREMKEETSINLKVNDLKLVGIYSNPRRDPRRSTISISFYSEINKIISPKAGDDAIFAEFKENWQKEKLAFDHKIIIKDSISKFRSDVKNKINSSAIILASGSGERFGKSKKPKHLVLLKGVPIIIWTISNILKSKLFKKIIVVTLEKQKLY